jgi:hypothetical protein
MARRRIHGRKKRSPVKFWEGVAATQRFGENQTNYNPGQQALDMKLQMQDSMDAERYRRQAEYDMKRQRDTQTQQMQKLQQAQQKMMQSQQQQSSGAGGDGNHTHRGAGLGGIINSVGRGKGGQSQSPFYHKKKY